MGDKDPRHRAKLTRQKRAAADQPAPRGKRVVASPEVSATLDRPFRFRFDRVDLGGPWCLTSITPEDHRVLIDFMREMEGLPMKQVVNGHIGKREDVAGSSPNPDAQKRAREIYYDDHDRIHSLHISGPKRVWGLQFEHEFSVIWWDPNHEVWPTRRVYEN